MKVIIGLMSAAGMAAAALLFSTNNSAAFFMPQRTTSDSLVMNVKCSWVKRNPGCWGDTCEMRKVCGSPVGKLRAGATTRDISRPMRRPY